MRLLLAVTIALLAAWPTLAAGPNGGQMQVADGHPVEFVPADTGLTFYLGDDDGRPLDTAGLSAKAYVQVGGRTQTLVLRPAPPNRLTADLAAPLPPGAKVVFSAKVHGHSVQARFE